MAVVIFGASQGQARGCLGRLAQKTALENADGAIAEDALLVCTVLQSPFPRRALADQVAFALAEYCGIFRTLVSAIVAFVRIGVKAPVHRKLGSVKSRTMTMDVVEIAAGRPSVKLFVDIARINVIISRLSDCRSRWIRVARLRSLVTV